MATAGSVDDGKSTLIGRLLYDAKAILTDQLDDLHRDGELDLSRLTDGLRAEREQGITIDVAYRYFATPRRKFILADTPGHVQYTRNMVTGASTADLAIILVDARKGVIEQTKRHAFIASLLGIPHVVVAVNKMDLVAYDEETFDAIVRDFSDFAAGLPSKLDTAFIPISALVGDNVVDVSEQTPWYGGLALLEHLETVEVASDRNLDDLRFPVQYVIRDGSSDYRAYAGQLAGGVLRAGEEVLVLPSERVTTIASIDTFDGPLEEALPPMSVSVRLADELDVSRGDLICRVADRPSLERELSADVCWMADAPLRAGMRLAIKHATFAARVIVEELVDRVEIHSLQREGSPQELALNDIGRVRIRAAKPLAFDPYTRNRQTGAFILIDDATNETVGAGLIAAPEPVSA
ncbi:MAG TPA: GTP-binding protein [Solirubrobacteraceae bacterium]|nr:GTP-binding protein [Solirubrobacteraceae bacterium]